MLEERRTPDLLYALQGLALARNFPIPEALVGLEMFAPVLDDIRQDKALFLLNFVPQPNEKSKPRHAVSVSGGLLWDGGTPILAENDVMERALALAVLQYARRCWRFEW